MNTEETIEFLKARLALCREVMGDRVRGLEDVFAAIEPGIRSGTKRDAAQVENDWEEFMRIALSADVRNEIDSKLKKRFGYSRLSGNPISIVQRIERTKKIADDDEARIVQGFLANLDDKSISAKSRALLDVLLAKYEQSKAKTG